VSVEWTTDTQVTIEKVQHYPENELEIGPQAETLETAASIPEIAISLVLLCAAADHRGCGELGFG
jgi:hypothetical protein